MDTWNSRLNAVNNNIAKLEKVNVSPVGRDQDTIEKQQKEMKVNKRVSCVGFDLSTKLQIDIRHCDIKDVFRLFYLNWAFFVPNPTRSLTL